MATRAELDRLLSLVHYNARLSCVEGLDPIRGLLDKDSSGEVVRSLKRAMGKLGKRERGGIAFLLADHWRSKGDLVAIRGLYAADDAEVKQAVLNGLWGEPGGNPEMGPGIMALAVEGASHPAPSVRAEACSVFQNQCAWGVDVGPAIASLLTLLTDEDPNVRRMAALATGNVCKRRFDWSQHLTALRRLLEDAALYVPEAAAWALAELSRAKHDIGPAVPDLIRVLADVGEYSEPRKEAAKALLRHARKSPTGRDQVRQAVAAVSLDGRRKEVKRFLGQLGGL